MLIATVCRDLATFVFLNMACHSLTQCLYTEKEAWLPVIKRLYKLASQANSRVYIHSVWVIERPNHGDAALLNEVQLREHYRVMCTSFLLLSATAHSPSA